MKRYILKTLVSMLEEKKPIPSVSGPKKKPGQVGVYVMGDFQGYV